MSLTEQCLSFYRLSLSVSSPMSATVYRINTNEIRNHRVSMNKAEAIQRSTTTFNSAADYFDAPALSFWNRFGQNTVDYLR